MRFNRFTLFCLYTFSILSLPTQAKDIALWEFTDNKKSQRNVGQHNIKYVHRNNQLLKGDTLILAVSQTKSVKVTVNDVIFDARGTTVFARSSSKHKNEKVILTLNEDNLFAYIETPSGVYRVDTNIQGTVLSSNKIDQNKEKTASPAIDYITADNVGLNEFASNSSSSNHFADESDTSIARLGGLFVYTKRVGDLYGDALQTKIDHIITVTNSFLQNSGVHIELYKASTYEIEQSYDQNYAFPESLEHISQGQPPFQSVSTKRFESGSDFVSFLRLNNGTGGGYAWVNTSQSGINSANEQMFHVISIDGEENLLAHELGHNLGLTHSRRQDGRGGIFEYGLGYGVDSEFTTIMAYPDFFGVLSNQVVNLFSTPKLTCKDGLACGVEASQGSDSADAVKALNAVRFQAEDLFKEPDLTPIETTLEQISDSGFRACLSDLIANSDIRYSAQIKTLHCQTFDESQTDIVSIEGISNFPNLVSLKLDYNAANMQGLSELANLTQLVELNLWGVGVDNTELAYLSNLTNLEQLVLGNNQLTDISVLEKLVNLKTLNLTGNVHIEDISVIANFKNISALFLSNNNISDVSPLAQLTKLQKLGLGENKITNISALSNLTLLYQLTLNTNEIESAAPLSNLTELTELTLLSNNISDISMLSSLTKLQRFFVSDNPISDVTVVSHFKDISELIVGGVGGEGITDLSFIVELQNIKMLFFGHTSISNIEFVEQLPLLTQISFDSSLVKDISPLFSNRQLDDWSINNLGTSGTIYCWQIRHIASLYDITVNISNECSPETDFSDFDGDGRSNTFELDAGTDPTVVDSFDGIVPATRFDQNGDGMADVLWRNQATGANYLWTMDGLTFKERKVLTSVSLGWNIAGRGDFNGDGKSDILWRHKDSGRNYIWLMDGFSFTKRQEVNGVSDTQWQVKAVSDFDGDGKADIFWHHQQSGRTYLWLMNGFERVESKELAKVSDTNWQVVASGDINGDLKSDIIWRNISTGGTYVWQMDGTTMKRRYRLQTISTDWQVVGAGDLDGDGTDDVVWRNSKDGRNWAHLMKDGDIVVSQQINTVTDIAWQVAMIGDLDGDGKVDIFWRHATTGDSYIYLMDGTQIKDRGYSTRVSDASWRVIP